MYSRIKIIHCEYCKIHNTHMHQSTPPTLTPHSHHTHLAAIASLSLSLEQPRHLYWAQVCYCQLVHLQVSHVSISIYIYSHTHTQPVLVLHSLHNVYSVNENKYNISLYIYLIIYYAGKNNDLILH